MNVNWKRIELLAIAILLSLFGIVGVFITVLSIKDCYQKSGCSFIDEVIFGAAVFIVTAVSLAGVVFDWMKSETEESGTIRLV